MRPTTEQRFWPKVASRDEGECWLWTATKNRSGYAQFKLGGRMIRSHRWAYEALIGPIPEGMVLDHTCGVRHCVNPAHLEPVTQRENVERGTFLNHTRKTHCAQGHEFTAENTFYGPLRGTWTHRRCRQCSRERGRAYYHRRKAAA